MKYKKFISIILISLILITGLVSGLFFKFVSHEKLSSEIYENVSLMIEKTSIRHGKMEVKYGWNLNFLIPKFEIISKVDNKPLLEIESIEIKAPLLSIFFPGFPVNYKFSSMKVHAGERFNTVINIEKLQERMTYKKLLGPKNI